MKYDTVIASLKKGYMYKTIIFEYMTFSDGAGSLRLVSGVDSLDMVYDEVTVNIPTSISCDSVYSILLQLEELLPKVVTHGKFLNVPYFPYARADRKFDEGMCVPKEVFYNFVINVLGYHEIITTDIHSNEGETPLVNSLSIDITQIQFSSELKDGFTICVPDKGAISRCEDFLDGIKALYPINEYDIVYCDKERDVNTGYIKHYSLKEGSDVKGKNVVIVDDICDGGRTFIMCAEALKAAGANKLGLVVTHGIFSKGLDELNKHFDFIECENRINV